MRTRLFWILPFGLVAPTGTGTTACVGALGCAEIPGGGGGPIRGEPEADGSGGPGGAYGPGGVLCCAWTCEKQNAASKIDKDKRFIA
jgi:hypothetical protein